MVETDAVSWMQMIALGGLAGAIGQTIRVVVGIKKQNDAATASNTALADHIVPSRLIVSLVIGFVAGAFAATQILPGAQAITAQQIFALVAAGYAGADFIEGMMTRMAPATSNAATGR